uniref:NAC domain-containing protein n=1 Tax=Cucumis sativus TaxID=3659 RepID=A0A0A0LFJ5_CUCSA
MDSSSGSLPLPLNHYVGVKFRPTDQQLLHYLHCKIYGQPYFQGAVFDFDLYGGVEPWEIWQSFGGIDGEDLYFFTKLKRSTTNSGNLSTHINRKIGLVNGTWSGENSASPIYVNEDDQQIIGYRKRFRYENESSEEHHGEWIMHEYNLHPNYLCEGVDPNYVLCRIRRNERARRKLEIQGELKQPNKKRIKAPKISRNERPKAKTRERCDELQPIDDQRAITCETIYNSDIRHDMKTHQDISVVDYLPNMTTNQDNINENISLGTEDYEPCMLTDDELKDIQTLGEFSTYIQNNFDETLCTFKV